MADLGTAGLIGGIINAIVMIPLSALALMISTKIFKLADSSYKTAIKIAFILGILSILLTVIGYFVPAIAGIAFWLGVVIISIIVALWLIKSSYKVEWGKAALVWLVWFVLNLIVAFVVALILGVLLLIIGVSALVATG